MRRLLIAAVVAVWVQTSLGADFYAAPAGTNTASGSIGSPWDLATALNQPAAVHAGDTIWLRGGTYRINNVPNKFISWLAGTSNAVITVRGYPGERATIDGNLSQFSGGWVNYRDLEFTDSFTNRTTTESGPWPDTWWKTNAFGIVVDYCVSGFDLRAPNVKLINCVVHDNVGGGIGVNTNATGSEVYGCLSYYNGWQGSDRGHGHGLYLQNAGPATTKITDSMFFENYAIGAQAYGSTNPLVDYVTFTGNAFFMNGNLADSHQQNFVIGPFEGMARSPVVVSNCVYDIQGSSADTYLGYTGGTSNAVVTNNYFATKVQFGPYTNLTLYGNAFLSNDVYVGLTTNAFPNNTYQTTPPTSGTKIIVRPNAYETGRANIVIFNWANAGTVSLDVSGIGLPVGARYALHNAQDFYSDIVTGTYSGTAIVVPMTNHTVATPMSHAAPVSTFPKFGAFVITMTSSGTVPPSSTVTNIGPISLPTTKCNSPVLGAQALDPGDTSQDRAHQATIPRAFVKMDFDYSHISTGDWSRADALMALNNYGPKICVTISATTSNNISNAVAAVIARYTNAVWSIAAQNEPDDSFVGATNYARFFNQARAAIDASGYAGRVRLAGPCLSNDNIPGFMAAITNLIGGIARLDVVDAHDYYAVPGNGSIPGPHATYRHVTSGCNSDGTGPNLAARLAEMNRWQAMTGKTNMAVISEYGLYDSNTTDAINAARAFKTNNVAAILAAPGGRIHSPLPIGHTLPNGLWDKPLTEFLKELCR